MDDMLTSLRQRPAGEEVWTSLRHVLDVLVSLFQAPAQKELVEPIHRVVFETPALKRPARPMTPVIRHPAYSLPQRLDAALPRSTPGSPQEQRAPLSTSSIGGGAAGPE
ncbi:hypothetical protein ACIHCQ_21800 [Streptomyces sp. NPDC052236]|uniref:hypothetical protein n=1 Tax=Streptomyces sp. NPDC052236 TaxID=3365686 RepID=UPI0037CF22D8